jgi:hypothetical protein
VAQSPTARRCSLASSARWGSSTSSPSMWPDVHVCGCEKSIVRTVRPARGLVTYVGSVTGRGSQRASPDVEMEGTAMTILSSRASTSSSVCSMTCLRPGSMSSNWPDTMIVSSSTAAEAVAAARCGRFVLVLVLVLARGARSARERSTFGSLMRPSTARVRPAPARPRSPRTWTRQATSQATTSANGAAIQYVAMTPKATTPPTTAVRVSSVRRVRRRRAAARRAAGRSAARGAGCEGAAVGTAWAAGAGSATAAG